jgi:hypothetical protein
LKPNLSDTLGKSGQRRDSLQILSVRIRVDLQMPEREMSTRLNLTTLASELTVIKYLKVGLQHLQLFFSESRSNSFRLASSFRMRTAADRVVATALVAVCGQGQSRQSVSHLIIKNGMITFRLHQTYLSLSLSPFLPFDALNCGSEVGSIHVRV